MLYGEPKADEELPEGLSVFAGCQALCVEQQLDDSQRCSRERSDRLQQGV